MKAGFVTEYSSRQCAVLVEHHETDRAVVVRATFEDGFTVGEPGDVRKQVHGWCLVMNDVEFDAFFDAVTQIYLDRRQADAPPASDDE